MIKKGSILLFILFFLASPGAAVTENSGTSEFDFLKIPPSARGVGMGDAFVAIADDLSALSYNPAGLAQIRKEQISTSYLQWLQDIWCGYINYGKPFNKKGTLGVSLFYLTAVDIEKRGTATDEKMLVGSVNVNNGVAVIGYGNSLTDKVLLGLNFKVAYENYESKAWNAGAVDLGLLLKFNNTVSAGVTLTNLSLFGGVLPFGQRGGVACKVHRKVTCAVDVYGFRDTGIRYSGGLEYNYNRNLSFRVGYKGFEDFLGKAEGSLVSSLGLDEIPGLSFGVGLYTTQGLRGHTLKFDYAFVPYGRLGVTNHFSLGFEF